MSPVFWLAGAGILAAAALISLQWVRPLLQIRRMLDRFARRDFRADLPLPTSSVFFRNMLRDIRTISEHLQQFDRQAAEEGFSLRAILSGMVEGVLIADRSQNIRLVNPALVRFLGGSPLNRSVIEVFRKHELQRALDAAFDDGQPREIAITLEAHPAGGGSRTRHFDVHIAGLMPEPQARPTAALVVFHDVTTIKTLEATRREFLANVSHEFRTPLTIINGYLETLMDGAMADEEMAARSLLAMHKNTRRLALLIDDLLVVSQLEDRTKLLEFRTTDLREQLAQALDHLKPKIAARGAVIEVDWSPDAREAEADGRRIEQVYANLLENSLRYAEVADLLIRVTARLRGRDICITVSDNGQGIPIGDQPHIFERFYRIHKDRSRDAGGTGLGLSIVKGVVQAHGGRVSVESSPGNGATFHISLPATQNIPDGQM